jgi:nitrate reductase assembly molybdenum cofactor insertion protein NarJ
MDTLHNVIRSIRHETKSRPDHLSVFREFLGHLDRAARRARSASTKDAAVKRRKTRRRAKH